jgi:uncharacterized repeat protein (TIGR01451 family)
MILTRSARTWLAVVAGSSLALAACGPQGPDETEARTAALTGTAPQLIATATLDQAIDFAGLTDLLENGLPQNVLGGIGSGLTYAGGTTFLAVPDRGPNATSIPNGGLDDNTTSFISRVETLDLALSQVPAGGLPLTLTPKLEATTLLWSPTALVYGTTPGLPSAVPPANTPDRSYFTGRSDNFGAGLSTDPDFARFDPEAIRVSRDGNTVFVADEYGPYIYQFDRPSGKRVRNYQLPDHFAIQHLSAVGATEISGNTIGRVTNKGVEGLAITPDGATLVALVQSPLLQDGGDGGRANRIVTIDVGSGVTHEYVYDNAISVKGALKAFNSSEIIALNDHQFLIDTRDGKGLGDGSVAAVKQLWAVDIAGATDVAGLSTEQVLLGYKVPKTLFLDIVAVLTANGVATTQIPAKIEGLAFGPDVQVGGVTEHTLFLGNDNDFVPAIAGPNRWFVFGFTDADLPPGFSYTPQSITERGPDLALTKTAAADSVVTGTPIQYTLAIGNTGLVPASDVLVSDLLPPELSFVSCASSGACGSSASGPTVSFPTLAGTGSAAATITAMLGCDVADGTVVVNHATAAFDLSDPTPANNAAASSIVAVNPAPVIADLSVDSPVLWPPDGKMKTVIVSYNVSDNCAGTVCALDVRSNEGSSADRIVVDAHTVTLRARRDGNGSGRTYSIPVTCRDSGGAVSTATATVVVPHDQS